MHSRAQGIFKSIKKEIKGVTNPQAYLTSSLKGNLEEIKEVDRTIAFIRKFTEILFEAPARSKWLKGTDAENNRQMMYFFQFLLKAILADIYKVGNCGEQAFLGLMRLLKIGINNKIEVVKITGFPANGTVINTHVFLVIDRNLGSNIEDPSSWKNFIKFDTWGEPEVLSYHGNQSPTKDSLGTGAINPIKTIEVVFCWDRNLSIRDCDQIITFLKNVKEECTETSLMRAYKESKRGFINVKDELTIIWQHLNDEIQNFKSLKNSPPLPPHSFIIKPYVSATEYSPTLFKENPSQTSPYNPSPIASEVRKILAARSNSAAEFKSDSLQRYNSSII